MADRLVDAYIVVTEPRPPYVTTECEACGFDSVLAFPASLLTSTGVATVGEVKACIRCNDAEDVDDH